MWYWNQQNVALSVTWYPSESLSLGWGNRVLIQTFWGLNPRPVKPRVRAHESAFLIRPWCTGKFEAPTENSSLNMRIQSIVRLELRSDVQFPKGGRSQTVFLEKAHFCLPQLPVNKPAVVSHLDCWSLTQNNLHAVFHQLQLSLQLP